MTKIARGATRSRAAKPAVRLFRVRIEPNDDMFLATSSDLPELMIGHPDASVIRDTVTEAIDAIMRHRKAKGHVYPTERFFGNPLENLWVFVPEIAARRHGAVPRP
ncbi:MAG: hypothetical protein FJX47_03935 [Alphaproteobacteria bacterium]|nr:hypothetical protein [Alphaproteobacteria bacterium]